MDTLIPLLLLASYNCNTYGAGDYNHADSCTDTGQTTTPAPENTGLAPTGTDIAVGAGVGLALIVLGAILFLKVRRGNTGK